MVLVIVGPSLAIGLLVSIFQAATQINEQTLSFYRALNCHAAHHYGNRLMDD